MAKQFESLSAKLQAFIEAQHIFFVATAAADGRVNVSPKGGDALSVLGPNRLIWRNITGSGNETAGHLRQVNRMTLMWCGFEQQPMILRIYGAARAVHPRDTDWAELNGAFPHHAGARQVFDMSFDLVQTSCGYAVPYMAFQSDRSTLDEWTAARDGDAIETYWRERNQQTIDGAPTGILAE